jgi:hypothetical protein
MRLYRTRLPGRWVALCGAMRRAWMSAPARRHACGPGCGSRSSRPATPRRIGRRRPGRALERRLDLPAPLPGPEHRQTELAEERLGGPAAHPAQSHRRSTALRLRLRAALRHWPGASGPNLVTPSARGAPRPVDSADGPRPPPLPTGPARPPPDPDCSGPCRTPPSRSPVGQIRAQGNRGQLTVRRDGVFSWMPRGRSRRRSEGTPSPRAAPARFALDRHVATPDQVAGPGERQEAPALPPSCLGGARARHAQGADPSAAALPARRRTASPPPFRLGR